MAKGCINSPCSILRIICSNSPSGVVSSATIIGSLLNKGPAKSLLSASTISPSESSV